MKKVFFAPAALFLVLTVQAQVKKATKIAPKSAAAVPVTLKTSADSLSYAFGLSLGQYMKSQDITKINFAVLNKACDQAIKGQPTLLDMNQVNQLMTRLAENKMRDAAAGNKLAGKTFLEKNKARTGVVQTASGLQYEVLVKGTGPVPTKEDTIIAHYKGELLNGKEFDNSYKRGEPITIPVAGVIPGWTEALTLMPVGSKWKLYIPAEIGYGDYGAGQDIPGGSTLVFEVELLSIKK